MKSIWDTEELANHWSLSFEEMQLLKSKPNRNQLAFVSQLKFYQNSGRRLTRTKATKLGRTIQLTEAGTFTQRDSFFN